MSEKPAALPERYSMQLRFLIFKLLEKDAAKRPDTTQILNYSPVQHRVRVLVGTSAGVGDAVAYARHPCAQMERVQREAVIKGHFMHREASIRAQCEGHVTVRGSLGDGGGCRCCGVAVA